MIRLLSECLIVMIVSVVSFIFGLYVGMEDKNNGNSDIDCMSDL